MRRTIKSSRRSKKSWVPRIQDAEPYPTHSPYTIYQDNDLWIVSKPAGWLTHDDGQGKRPNLVAWCESPVGIHQRLDIDTTGVVAFSRTPQGAKTLQSAFERRTIHKEYVAIVDRKPPANKGIIKTPIPGTKGAEALTKYEVLKSQEQGHLMKLIPVTGRTHQIRIHLASLKCPIRGDGRFGNPLDKRAPRTLLHCHSITLPDGRSWTCPIPADFGPLGGTGENVLRTDLATDPETTCYRLFHGQADGTPGWYVDRYDDWLWVHQDDDAPRGPLPEAKGVYLIHGHRDRSRGAQSLPQLIRGRAAPDELIVREHGVRYSVQLGPQLSTGMFLDQKPQRAWLARNAAGLHILNTFAHAGAFSIAAASAGATTVSIDLSRHWIERIPRQLDLNHIEHTGHDWIYGDVFQWMPKLAKRGDVFDMVILDPPSTSVGRKKKRWSVKKDYPELVSLAVSLLKPGGLLWTSTNHRGVSPLEFAELVTRGAPNLRLERVCAPAVDYPAFDTPFLKTFVWRWPGHAR